MRQRWQVVSTSAVKRQKVTVSLAALVTIAVGAALIMPLWRTSGVRASASSGSWAAAAAMLEARAAATAVRLKSGEVLVSGGFNNTVGVLNTAEVYNPFRNTWTATGPVAGTHFGGETATLLTTGGVLLIGGGFGLPNVDLYTPTTHQWTAAANLEVGRQWHTASLLPDGDILVAGGQDANGKALASTEIYDVATNHWSLGIPMNEARWGATAVTLPDGRVLVAGGANAQNYAVNTAEIYDPATNTWADVAAATSVQAIENLVLLKDGHVLAIGWISGSFDMPGAIYNPATNSWMPITAANIFRENFTVTLLDDGMVLLAGGNDPGNNARAEAVLYDPSRDLWLSAPNMITPRDAASAVLLPSGRVLEAGGYDGLSTASAELYTPIYLGHHPIPPQPAP